MRPGIGDLADNTTRRIIAQRCLHRVIQRASDIGRIGFCSHIWVKHESRACCPRYLRYIREVVSSIWISAQRRDVIDVIRIENLVHAMRADISNLEDRVLRYLLLQIGIALDDIAARRVTRRVDDAKLRCDGVERTDRERAFSDSRYAPFL